MNFPEKDIRLNINVSIKEKRLFLLIILTFSHNHSPIKNFIEHINDLCKENIAINFKNTIFSVAIQIIGESRTTFGVYLPRNRHPYDS